VSLYCCAHTLVNGVEKLLSCSWPCRIEIGRDVGGSKCSDAGRMRGRRKAARRLGDVDDGRWPHASNSTAFDEPRIEFPPARRGSAGRRGVTRWPPESRWVGTEDDERSNDGRDPDGR